MNASTSRFPPQRGHWLATEGGLRPAERAAVFAGNSVEWAAAALAIQAVGGVMVPVYPASTDEQAAYILEHCDAAVCFVGGRGPATRLAGLRAALPALRHAVALDDAAHEADTASVSWGEAQARGAEALAKTPELVRRTLAAIDLDAPGLMLYTSGTSGPPKGVPLSHRNVGVNGRYWLLCNAPLLHDGATDILWLPMSHIFGFGEMCLGNTLGFTSYLCGPQEALPLLPELRPQVFMSVPSHWEKLAQSAVHASSAEERRSVLQQASGGRLRFCLSGGAGLKREIKELFHEAGILLIEGYGLTESSPTLTLNRPDAFRFDTVGKPLPSVELRLAEDGEIEARGPNVFAGYHKAPEATREAFTEDGWLKTGDIGRFTEDGFLQIIDRKKDILVTAGGKNIAPANLELRFRDEPCVAHAVVYGDGRRYLVAGLWVDAVAADLVLGQLGVASQERPAALQARLQACVARVNASVASYESIKKWTVMAPALTVEGGMLTASMKVRRKHVYQAYAQAFEALYAPEALSA